MDNKLKDLLGDGPYPFPTDSNFGGIVEVYAIDGVATVTTVNCIDMPVGCHAHDSYEFLIPMSYMPSVRIDQKRYQCTKNMVFPFNPGQFHGPAVTALGCRLAALQLDRKVVEEAAEMTFGKNKVHFDNINTIPSTELQFLIKLFNDEMKNKQRGYEFVAATIKSQAAVLLLRQLKSNMPEQINQKIYKERKSINRVIEYMSEYYSKDFSLEEIAREANLSPYHFIRVFKEQTGKTPYDYFLDIKVCKAQEILRYSNQTVTEACFSCGFNSLEHFASVFKRKTGILPSQYQKLFPS